MRRALLLMFLVAALPLAGEVARGQAPPGIAAAQFQAAAEKYGAGNWRGAAAALRRFVDDHPRDQQVGTARFFLGESLAQAGEEREANAVLDQFLRDHPHHPYLPRAKLRLAELSLRSQNETRAVELLRQVQKDAADNAAASLALAYLGLIELRQGASERAEQFLNDALVRDPHSPLASRCRLELAIARRERVPREATIAQLRDLTSVTDPAVACGAKFHIGLIHYRRGEWERARVAWEELRGTSTDRIGQGGIAYWLGLALAQEGQIASAGDKFQELLDQHPAHPLRQGAQWELMVIRVRQQRFAEAELLLQQWTASNAQAEWAAAAVVRQAELAASLGKIDALAEFAKRLAAQNAEPKVQRAFHRFVGRAHLDRKAYAEAIPSLAAVVQSPADEIPLASPRPRPAIFPAAALLPEPPEIPHASPVGAEDWYLLTVAQMGAGQMREAVVSLAGAAKFQVAGELKGRLLLARGSALLATGDAREAANDLAQFIAEFPSDPDLDRAKRLLAQARSQNDEGKTAGLPAAAPGQSPRAIAEEIPEGPTAAEAAWQSGAAEERAGRTDAALAAYHRCIAAPPPNAHLAGALRGAARMHGKLDQHREAEELLQRHLAEFPQSAESDSVWMELAQVRSKRGDRRGSLAALQQVSESFPKSPWASSARYRLAVEAVHEQRYSEAHFWLKKLPPIAPTDPLGAEKLLLAAQLSATLQKWNEVDPPLSELEAKFPQSQLLPTARFWRGEAAWRNGDPSAAARYFQPLATADAQRGAAWRPVAVLRAAQCLVREEQWGESLLMATRGVEESPLFAMKSELEYLAAYCLTRQGAWASAREWLERSARDPRASAETSARSQWLLGECLIQEGRGDEGVQVWLRLETRTDLPTWQAAGVLRAAEFLESRGEVAEARKLYARLVRQYASTAAGDEASRRLRQFMPAGVAESGRGERQ